MLSVAHDYQKAIDGLTSNREMDLQKHKMSGEEFEVVKELQDVLKASLNSATCFHQRCLITDHASTTQQNTSPAQRRICPWSYQPWT